MAEILETQEQFPVKAGIQGLNGIAFGDAGRLLAASAPRTGRFLLFGQKKSAKEKAARLSR
jgi:hypothetical protein